MKYNRADIVHSMPTSFTLDELNTALVEAGHNELTLQAALGLVKSMNAANPGVKYYKVAGEEAWRRKELGAFIAKANQYGASWRHKVQIVRRDGQLVTTMEPKEDDEPAPSWLRFESAIAANKFIAVAAELIDVVIDVSNHTMWSNKDE